MYRKSLGIVFSTLTLASSMANSTLADNSWGIREVPYAEVIQQVVNMPNDSALQQRTTAYGLGVVNVMWEDTGRAAGSSVGPNISDLTLQVRENVNGGVQTHLLPVIRYPNFNDKTADIAVDKLWVRVGNQNKGQAVAMPLLEVLRNLKEYLHDPSSLKSSGNFVTAKDTHFLVSAQHVFLPIPKSGKAEFNPVLFNYQSAPSSPAVMTLLVTREGTSATVVDNRGGDMSLQGWGQQLFFNHGGQKTVFTAERRSDVKKRIESGQAKPADDTALEEGADMMLIVQVPLKHKNLGYLGGLTEMSAPSASQDKVYSKSAGRGGSDVEKAVLGHGEDMGPFDEMLGLQLERDDRFPIRVTVQFYKATSNGVISDDDLKEVAQSIDKVYKSADYVGSLVVPEGERNRPTDWIKNNPDTTWGPFNGLHRFLFGEATPSNSR